MTTVALRGALSADPAARAALTDVLPVVLGVTPFALTIGATAVTTSVSPVASWLGGPLIAAGSAHLTTISLLGAGTSALGVVLAALVINARLAAYSAVLAPRFATQPTWFRWAGPYVLVDQTFALVLNRGEDDDRVFRTYLLVVSAVLLTAWVTAISVGMALGPVIPESWQLWFATPLMFTAMAIPSTRTRPGAVAALVGALLAVVLAEVPSGFGLIIAIMVGAFVGYRVSKQ